MNEEIILQGEDENVIPAESYEDEISEEPKQEENEESDEESKETPEETIDYGKILNDDIEELKKEFPELHSEFEITDLKDPIRFGALRDLGLSAKEAYLATGGKRRPYDTRAHLKASVPKSAVNPMLEIPHAELKMLRDLFSDMSDAELRRLYKKVNS